MLNFHPLKVTSVERVAEDAACVMLEIPPALSDAYAFRAGQYVTVRRRIGEREERRTYSIVTRPGHGVLKLGVRTQTGGRMSGELGNKLRAGDWLDVGTPMGRFHTAIDAARELSYVAFAAGSGITPILSLAAEVLAREPGSRFTLIYGNRSIARTMFMEETQALKNRYIDRFAVHFVMSREPQQTQWLNGRIDGAKVRELAQRLAEIAAADEYLICGPGNMVDEVRTALKALNDNAPIRFERFAAADASAGAGPPPLSQAAGSASRPQDVLATISVVMDGRRRSFPMSSGDASVLDAAERAGLELPFSCRSGICATCRARITHGAAVMTHNIALEPWETEAGFVLCCQARPTTGTLDISYDHK
ncbi:MAG: 2Fe-2S iron-sulfur cluster-binding protein [Steroidobacteraceae bacterium]